MSKRTAKQHLKLAQMQLNQAASNLWEAQRQAATWNPDIRWSMDDKMVAGLLIQTIRSLSSFVLFGRPYVDQFTNVVEDLVRERQALDTKFPGGGPWPSVTQTEHGP